MPLKQGSTEGCDGVDIPEQDPATWLFSTHTFSGQWNASGVTQGVKRIANSVPPSRIVAYGACQRRLSLSNFLVLRNRAGP